jgi:hypothetical protein
LGFEIPTSAPPAHITRKIGIKGAKSPEIPEST